MTPEEKAVIAAAVYLKFCIEAKTAGDPPRLGRLLDAVDDMLYACPGCDATGHHICRGCGKMVGHPYDKCSDCEMPPPLTDPRDKCQCPRIERVYCYAKNCHGGADVPEWYPRTYANVRTGDTIQHGHEGEAPAATVLSCSQERRHVKDGGTGKHWDDTAVEHGLTRVRLDYPGSDPNRILDIPSNLPVRIRLTAEEFRAIELLGWANRV